MLTTIPEITRHAPIRVPSSNIYHPSRNIFKESERDKSKWITYKRSAISAFALQPQEDRKITIKKNPFKPSFNKSLDKLSFEKSVNIRDKNYFIFDKSDKSNFLTDTPKKDIKDLNSNNITTNKDKWSIIDCYHTYKNQYLVRVPSYQWVNSRKIYRSHNSPNLPNLLGKWVYVESDTLIPIGDSISIGMKTHTNKKGVEITTYFYQ